MREFQRGAAALCVIALLAFTSATAHADAIDDINDKIVEAMSQFDEFEYEKARGLLDKAVLIAKTEGMMDDKIVALVYINLGIVYFSGLEEPDSAKSAFIDALTIDPNVTLDPAYKSPELEELLAEAREIAGSSKTDPDPDPDPDPVEEFDCSELESIQHSLVDEASEGAATSIEAHVAESLSADKVSLHYRVKGAEDFKTAKMKKKGECGYVGKIPGKAMKGEVVHYYVAAYDDGGSVLASKGSKGSPNIIEIMGGEIPDEFDKDPEDPETPGGVNKRKFYIALVAGSGGGYVTGTTEQVAHEVQCCFAPALFHVLPEIGFFISPKMAIGVAFRGGFPVGANRENHATLSPLGLLALRYYMKDTGDGIRLSGSIGAGLVRHTITLSGIMDGTGDVDTTATGPLFLGAGAGIVRNLGGPMQFVAEVNMLMGLPVVEAGDVDAGFGVQFDFNLGMLFAF
jgi:hypothetical protein